MDLSEIRQKFRDLTGRYDLVTANNTDEGADFFINAGQRWLDRKLDFQGAPAETTLSLSTGAYSASITKVRAVKNVFVDDTQDGYKELDKTSYPDLKKYILATDANTSGLPRWYSIGRNQPASRADVNEDILFWPPADQNHVLIVEGLYASSELESNGDESFWSVNFPDMLIKAAAMKAEPFQRNTSGEQDFRQSLLDELRGIDHDEVEEMIADVDHVKSNWRNIDL